MLGRRVVAGMAVQISCSGRNWRFSVKLLEFFAPDVVKPSLRSPSFHSACLPQFWIFSADTRTREASPPAVSIMMFLRRGLSRQNQSSSNGVLHLGGHAGAPLHGLRTLA